MAFSHDEKLFRVALVCQAMKDGINERAACRMNDVAPSLFWYWTGEDEEFKKMYEGARDALIRHWANDIIDIADTQQVGQIVKSSPQGPSIETRDMIQHRTLRIQSRQWLLSKLRPKQYGDKLALGGADDLPPIQSKSDVTLAPEDAYKQMIGIGGNGRT